MQSTLFTTLTPNEEANLSGGTNKTDIKITALLKKVATAKNTVTQKATGGAGGNGGAVSIGGGKSSPVVIIGTTINSSGGAGGDALNTSDNAVGAST
ncbi:MAG: hypothetical protein V7L01_03965 [Nostoc sp.]|uniref:hypothetical protein n=1 Tax=Nostoc sp. TaxID=1180 RepID=UPI002FFC07B7